MKATFNSDASGFASPIGTSKKRKEFDAGDSVELTGKKHKSLLEIKSGGSTWWVSGQYLDRKGSTMKTAKMPDYETQLKMLKKNPPKLTQKGNIWVTEVFSPSVNSYIPDAERLMEDEAKQELKILKRDHQGYLRKLTQLIKEEKKKTASEAAKEFQATVTANQDFWLTAQDVSEVCPSCAHKMASLNITKIKASVLFGQDEETFPKTADEWHSMPSGWTDESRKKFWESVGGSVTKCMEKLKGNVDDPGAFCASLKDRIEGDTDWRGPEKSAREEAKTAAQEFSDSLLADKIAKVFHNEDALKSYLKTHPKADPSKHSVKNKGKKDKGKGKPDPKNPLKGLSPEKRKKVLERAIKDEDKSNTRSQEQFLRKEKQRDTEKGIVDDALKGLSPAQRKKKLQDAIKKNEKMASKAAEEFRTALAGPSLQEQARLAAEEFRAACAGGCSGNCNGVCQCQSPIMEG